MIEALLQAERLLAHGMVDQAEQIYANAAEQDAHNAIAVVGLARVALERGDDRLAYERACAALAIDPQNVAALRLEARLSEVMAARGESVTRPSGFGAAARDSVPATPADQPVEVRPSEHAVFSRNPSMANHRQLDEQRAVPHASPRQARQQPAPEPPESARRGLFRRLLGE
jgi:thioredoxin-like negative regulator of GroEL